MRTHIRGGQVVAWANGHYVIRGGDLVLDGDRVAFVGRGYDGPADRVLDVPGRLVSPGFVNLHCQVDISHGLLWYDADRTNLYAIRPDAWLRDPHDTPVFTPDEMRAGARLGLGAALRSGATTVVGINTMVFKRWDDAPGDPDLFAQVADELGVRAYFSHHFRDGVVAGPTPHIAWNTAAGRRGLDRAIAFAERLRRRPNDRVRTLLFPYTLDTNSEAMLRLVREVATAHGLRIRMHFAQSRFEVEQVRKTTGTDPVEFLERIGFLGPDVILTHAMYIAEESDHDLDVLAAHGVSVAHCPVVMRGSGRVLRSFSRYRRAGVNVGLGTDTFPQDMVEEIRWASIGAKLADRHAASGLAAEAYEAATVGGARALGRDDLGRLTPGAKADVTIVDLRHIMIGPADDPIRSLVHYATQRDVEHVFVDGAQVVAHGNVTGLDVPAVLVAMERVTAKMAAQFVQWSGEAPAALFRPSFPTA
ncbi:MAG: chlorohydrolase family protein [Armatimonadota bacterium]|nr:chlorohydrolase family protein [Armatimonadota bacterium]